MFVCKKCIHKDNSKEVNYSNFKKYIKKLYNREIDFITIGDCWNKTTPIIKLNKNNWFEIIFEVENSRNNNYIITYETNSLYNEYFSVHFYNDCYKFCIFGDFYTVHYNELEQ